MFGEIPNWVILGGLVLVVFLGMFWLASLYRKAAPNEALVVYGFRKTRTVVGGGTVIFPVFENYRSLPYHSLSPWICSH